MVQPKFTLYKYIKLDDGSATVTLYGTSSPRMGFSVSWVYSKEGFCKLTKPDGRRSHLDHCALQ